MLFTPASPKVIDVAGSRVEYVRTGKGPSLLYLHGFDGVSSEDPFIAPLSEHFEVIAPTLPGFGASTRSKAMRNVDDLAHFGLSLARAFDLKGATLVGSSFGGWLAAEMAAKNSPHFGRLILSDPVGARFTKDPAEKEIFDLFVMEIQSYPELLFADPATADRIFRKLDFASMEPDAALRFCANKEGVTQFGWAPLLHNPGLRARLGHIGIPTLVLWGADDKVVSTAYGRQFAAEIPGAAFRAIDGAGHYLPLEQPEKFAHCVTEFVAAAVAAG